MTRFRTVLRVAFSLGVCVMWSQAAFAQTVLNFAKVTINGRFNAGFSITNPTSNFADVQFTYYGLDGNPVSAGLVNPVRYRVAPKGQIVMQASQLFAGSNVDGWVQVTSTTSGLTGFYLSGDFVSTLEGSDSPLLLSNQIVPVIRNDSTNKTELVVLNPGTTASTVAVTLFNTGGQQVGSVPAQVVAGHGALRISSSVMGAAAGTLSARISASLPVAATAIVDRGDALLFVSGQDIDQPASLRIAPHFITSGGFDPVLVLANPTASPTSVTVTVAGEAGGPAAAQRSFTVPPNGSLSAEIRTITGQPAASGLNGWLRVDSANVALAGLVILDQGQALTSIPLQTVPVDQMIFSQISETATLITGIALVNTSAADAVADVVLVRDDGTTIAEKSVRIATNSKLMKLVRDIVPEANSRTNGYIVIRSSTPLYGVGVLGAVNNSFLASIPAGHLPDGFTPNALASPPSITDVEPGTSVQAGMTLRVSLVNAVADPTVTIGGQVLTAHQVGAANPTYEVTVPSLEPGFVTLKVRSNDVDSDPILLRVLGSDNLPTQTISGQAFYQKIDVTDSGLDLAHPVMVPVRNARVEVFSRSSQSTVAVSETDLHGAFKVPVPADPNLTVRVFSRLRTSDVRVADNTNQGRIYLIAADFDGRQAASDLLVIDRSRLSGAFNILEIVQRANEIVKDADPNITLPAPAIFWSVRNRKSNGTVNIGQGLIGTTNFNVANNTAYILGDRNNDSDEFDDSVIAHEYAHLLAAKFSHDDSLGASHSVGDMLDPRLAWSEGFANFFSGVVRNDPIWRDSYGVNGTNVMSFDLEENVPAADRRPGYWSEASVASILWDLFDDHSDPSDDVQYPFSEIWKAFTDLRNDRFVYLGDFLDHFVSRDPASADAVRTIVQARSIDFQPSVGSSVAYPFPAPINIGATASGMVDSYTTRRTNLMMSSHFYSFTTTGGATSIRLDITGLGPGENPNANDLDLFLMDLNGRTISKSDTGLNGQGERIGANLAAGTYVVEIRSFYTKAERGGSVFNSGQYRLSVSAQ